jgi:hypothetical protein
MLQGHVGMASLHAKEAYPMTLHVARSQQIPAGEARVIYAKVPAADPQKALIIEEEFSQEQKIMLIKSIAAVVNCGHSMFVQVGFINP